MTEKEGAVKLCPVLAQDHPVGMRHEQGSCMTAVYSLLLLVPLHCYFRRVVDSNLDCLHWGWKL